MTGSGSIDPGPAYWFLTSKIEGIIFTGYGGTISGADITEFTGLDTWEKAEDKLPEVFALRGYIGLPVYVANIESSVHRERKGPKFSHYISHGFHIDDTKQLEEIGYNPIEIAKKEFSEGVIPISVRRVQPHDA